jgi:hypothetical protein
MDSYTTDPLPFCVKDVNDLEQALLSNCRFQRDNIFKITESLTPVKEQIDKAFSSIEKRFKSNKDLLFFYFSGHGEYDHEEGKSKVLFEDDTELTIEDIILRYFLRLSPKNQYLLIDACHSGSNIFFKGKDNPAKEIRRLDYNSSELCLMFATESKSKAVQGNGVQNSYFTYYLLEAIKKLELYDEDGLLTIQAIDNYLKKKVIEKSDFLQIPVSEIRSSGYKVFAFDEIKIQSKAEMKPSMRIGEINVNHVSGNSLDTGISFEDSLLPESRKNVQDKCVILVQNSIDSLIDKLSNQGLDVFSSNPFTDLYYNDQEKFFKKIIETSKQEGIVAVNGLFLVEQREERKLSFGGLGSIIDHLYQKSEPEFYYRIETTSDDIFTVGLTVKANNVYQVSCGFFVLFFQAKFGFAICLVKYNYSWTGTSDKGIKYIGATIRPFLLNEYNESITLEYLKSNITDFEVTLDSWNTQRQREIENFKSKAQLKK